MTTEVKRLIRVRVEKGATFKRDGYGKKRQLSDSWRKPRGQHNKQREQKKAKGALPKPGFGSPIAVRGMHPSGFFEVLVATATELEGLDPKTQAVRISGTVGDRKRVGLQAAAIAAGLKVLNAKTVQSATEKEKATPAAKGSTTSKKETKKPANLKATNATAKKGTKKVTVAAPEAKKDPVKETKKAVKLKAENVPEETAVKAPVKAVKKPAKPNAEKSPEPAEAKQNAVTKPKATKKTGSEVKKNE
ncbi:MAG: 50S ribosomal protein L32e [Methanoregula sp.]|nr:50S ribosomal protein L32e [Methanoregula sp.]